jgi:hypothetical protein
MKLVLRQLVDQYLEEFTYPKEFTVLYPGNEPLLIKANAIDNFLKNGKSPRENRLIIGFIV